MKRSFILLNITPAFHLNFILGRQTTSAWNDWIFYNYSSEKRIQLAPRNSLREDTSLVALVVSNYFARRENVEWHFGNTRHEKHYSHIFTYIYPLFSPKIFSFAPLKLTLYIFCAQRYNTYKIRFQFIYASPRCYITTNFLMLSEQDRKIGKPEGSASVSYL